MAYGGYLAEIAGEYLRKWAVAKAAALPLVRAVVGGSHNHHSLAVVVRQLRHRGRTCPTQQNTIDLFVKFYTVSPVNRGFSYEG